MLLAIAVVALLVDGGAGQRWDDPPAVMLHSRDLAADYHLPPLRNRLADPLYQSLRHVQVIARAEHFGLTSASATEAWRESGAILAAAQRSLQASPHAPPRDFSGSRASELNRFMAQPRPCVVRVRSPLLLLDTPIYPGNHCHLDLGRTKLQSQGAQPYQIQIKNRSDVWLSGGRLTGGQWGVSVARSRNVVVTSMQMDALGGGGVMITGSHEVTLWRNRFSRLGGAGVMLHGDTQHTVVAENEMLADTGWSNWHAGIVVTDRIADPADDSTTLLRPDGILTTQTRITDRLTIPHDNLVLRNRIAHNKTSGIYSDGGARNVFLGNTIESNSKEGMCLDNGSTANVVAYNVFRANGKRWGMDDADLKRDFVWNFGRLPDGTSPAKLPGISMDNSAYNQIVHNQIDHNFGSGVKMVRTSFYNQVGLNELTDDNEGSNPILHYFGILVGFASADESAWDLDFLPSRGNQIFANNIRGSNFAGIFFEDKADQNVVFDNSISGAVQWAMDSFRRQAEETSNNLSNLPFRNIDSGLDPASLRHGKGVNRR